MTMCTQHTNPLWKTRAISIIDLDIWKDLYFA